MAEAEAFTAAAVFTVAEVLVALMAAAFTVAGLAAEISAALVTAAASAISGAAVSTVFATAALVVSVEVATSADMVGTPSTVTVLISALASVPIGATPTITDMRLGVIRTRIRIHTRTIIPTVPTTIGITPTTIATIPTTIAVSPLPVVTATVAIIAMRIRARTTATIGCVQGRQADPHLIILPHAAM